MILEGAIGDAYGAGFEFVSREVIEKNNHLLDYNKHPSFPKMRGKYTDDTQMSLALAELIINDEELTTQNIADKFVQCFKRDPRSGYAGRFYDFLVSIEDGTDLLNKIHNISIKNGAAMRAYPLGVLDNTVDIMTASNIQARITHDTREGILSSQAVALMSHYTLYKKGELRHIHQYLEDVQGITWNKDWAWEIECDGMETTDAIVTLLASSPDKMSDLLLDSVNFGGDVDTVASVALAIASNSAEVENDIPIVLHRNLEKGLFGIDYIKKIDKMLMEKVKM